MFNLNDKPFPDIFPRYAFCGAYNNQSSIYKFYNFVVQGKRYRIRYIPKEQDSIISVIDPVRRIEMIEDDLRSKCLISEHHL